MAAILKLRRGTSFTSLQESELFYDTALGTIHLGDGGGSNTTYKTLVKLTELNSGSIYLNGDITGSHISASGDISASNLKLVGDADIMGNITLGGDIFLGDGTNATDNINVNASFSGSLIPTTTSVFTLGSDTKKYLDLRVVNATIDNINLPGSGILSSSVTDFTDYSQSVDNRLDIEEAKSVILQTVTSSLDNRLDVEEAKSVTLQTVTSSLDNRLDVEESKSLTLTALTASYDIRLSNLQITSASHDNRLDVEEAKSVTLATVTSSLDQRADRLEAYTSSFASDTVTLTSKTINGANNTLTVDISRDTNLAVSDTTEVNMILTDDTISAELIGGVVSGSSQINADTVTNFDSNVKTKLDDETVVSGSAQVIDFVTAGDLDMSGNKVLFGNVYSTEGDLPSASSYHGMFAHVHATGKAYYAHGGNWIKLIDESSSDTNDLTEGSSNLYYTDTRVKTKLDAETVISGSSQVNYSQLSGINNDIVSASTDTNQVDMIINDGSISANLKGGVVSGSSQINADTVTNFDANVKTKLDDETVVSGSIQIDYSGLSGINNDIVSASTDSGRVNFTISDGNITADLIGGVVTGSIQVLGGSTILSSSNETFSSYSSSVDGRLDTIEGPLSTSIDNRLDLLSAVSHSHANKSTLDGINQGLSTSDNVTFADGDFTGDVQVTGNLTVLGAATEISSTELRIEDKLITVASGSADSAAADGAGIEIDGAGKSLKWDHNTTSFVLDAKVSSSVGFKGEGGELTGIDTDQVTEAGNLYYTDSRVKTKLNDETVVSGSSQVNYSSLSGINNNIISASSDTSQVDMIINGGSISANLKGGVVSGSSQINSDQTTGWVADVRKQIDNAGLISGSVQVNANTITNFDANVKTKLDDETVISGSSQVNANTITNFDANVKTKLDDDGVISGSVQVNANTITNFDSNVKAKLDAETVVSGSSQIVLDDADKTGFNTADVSEHSSNLYYTDARVKLKLDAETVVSGSSQINADTITNFDSNVKAKLDAETVVSGSSQIDIHSTDGYVANENIDHSSITIGSGKGLSGGGTIETNRSISLDTGSAHFDEGIKKVIDADNVFSSSAQVNANTIANFDANVKTKLDDETVISGSTFSSPSQGTVRATINGANTDVDTGLQTSDSPQFTTLTLSNVAAGGSTDFDAVFDVSGLLKKRTIGTAAFLNVSASIADDPNSIPTTKAVNDALIEAGAGDITAVNSTSTISPTTTGIVHTQQGTESGGAYGNVGNVVIAIATGSAHFVNAVQGISPSLPSGLVSGSSQVTKTKGDVGLGNVDNESKSTMFSSPTFTGVPISTTPADNDDSTKIATTAFVMREVSDLLGGAPAAFDTLLEISSSIANGDSDVVSLTTSVAGKLQKDQNLSDLTNASTARTNLGVDAAGTDNSTDVTLVTTSHDYLSISGQAITLGAIANNDLSNSGITINGTAIALGGSVTTPNDNTEYSVGDGGLTTNDFTDDDHNKLNGIEIGADVTDAANVLTSLPAGIVSGSTQVSYNSIQNRPTTISTAQGNKLGFISVTQAVNLDTIESNTSTNNNKVGYTNALVKTKLDADSVVSGSLSDIKTFLSLSSSDISDVAAFSQSGTYSGLRAQSTTAGDVGLGNVTNESKSTMFASPSLTGNPTAPTQADNDNSTKVATTAYVQREVSDLLGGAPAAFDTLLEISASIANGDSDVVSLTSVVGTKLAKASNLSDLANASTARTNLGVAIGSDVQGYSAETAFLTGTQTFSGAKSFSSAVNIDATTASTTKTTGALIVDGGVGIAGAVNVGGDVVAFASSDKRLKNNIQPIENPIQKINSIGGYSFDWNEEKQDIYKGTDIGVIAQEIEEVLPELVQTRENGYKAVKYDKLVSLLIEGIKDLSKEVDELKRKINNQ